MPPAGCRHDRSEMMSPWRQQVAQEAAFPLGPAILVAVGTCMPSPQSRAQDMRQKCHPTL